MKKVNTTEKNSENLRKRAEKQLKKLDSKDIPLIDESDPIKLIHELQVHQIELEIQNEELLAAKEVAVNEMEKYSDLYNFAPAGYLTLSKEGDIIELNFSTANLLGDDLEKIKNTRFGLYITEDTLVIYNAFLDEVFSSNSKETCEILLTIKGEIDKFVHIEAIVLRDRSHCLLAMTDITDHKMIEDELLQKSKELKEFNKFFIGREFKMIELKKEINDLLNKSGLEKKYMH
ncbi:MAG: hypothetical protein GZ091_17045 [Paludibacter sp.]|nr:hypothetical protein [Paludibacter sp.]